jgi:hypothetical protein
MIVVFDSIVIRIRQLIISLSGVAFLLANHLDWLTYLHISKTASDRLEFVVLILIALNRPAGYIDKSVKAEKETV